MDQHLLTAIISTTTALVGVGLGSFLSRRREQEGDWRKLKLDCYREYVIALSGNIEQRATHDSRLRYCDAVNALLLVAPPNVLRAHDAFLKHTNCRNPDRNDVEKHDALLGELIRTMRKDLQPREGDDLNLRFKLLGVASEGGEAAEQGVGLTVGRGRPPAR